MAITVGDLDEFAECNKDYNMYLKRWFLLSSLSINKLPNPISIQSSSQRGVLRNLPSVVAPINGQQKS